MKRLINNSSIRETRVSIPDDELVFFTSRASGPGGQNVNKVETKVRLTFEYYRSRALSDRQKTLLSRSKIIQDMCNTEGAIVISSQQHRSQALNKEDAKKKLMELLHVALRPMPRRIKTKPSFASKLKRLESKARRGATKKQRRGEFD